MFLLSTPRLCGCTGYNRMMQSMFGWLVLAACSTAAVSGAAPEPYILYDDIQVPLSRHYRGLGSAALTAGLDSNQLWPRGRVHYYVADAALEDRVAWAVAHVEAKTCIRFQRCEDEARCLWHRRYMRFQGGWQCSSPLGVAPSGVNAITLASWCSAGTTVHEILHSLGVHHEQTRNDRDEFITVHYEHIDRRGFHNFHKSGRAGRDIGPYDYDSILHYNPTQFLITPGQQAIEAPVPIGQRSGMSPGDVMTVDFMYNGCSRKFSQPRCIASKRDDVVQYARGGAAFTVEFNGLYDGAMRMSYEDSTPGWKHQLSFSKRPGSWLARAGKTVATFTPSVGARGKRLTIAARFTGRMGAACVAAVKVEVV